MKFDNTKDIKHVFKQIHELMMSIAPEEKRLNEELEHQENITKDLLHEIELANLNAIERMKVYNDLRKCRKERRKIKDTIEFINTIRGYSKRFIEKGLLSETDFVMKKIDTYDQHRDHY